MCRSSLGKGKKKLISIYYCTRTVSQIKNVFKEINKTCYKLNVSFIASKKFICAKYKDSERKRMGSNELNDICKKMRKNKIKMKKKKGLLFSEQIQEEEEEDEDEIEDENINEIGDRMEKEIIEKEEKDFGQQENKDGEEKEEIDNDEEEIENNEEDENEDEKENKNLEICKYYKDETEYNYDNYNNLEDIEDLLKEGKKKKYFVLIFITYIRPNQKLI